MLLAEALVFNCQLSWLAKLLWHKDFKCSILTGLVANVFVHHEPVDDALMESGFDDEMSDGDDAEVKQKIVYKIGKFW